MVASCIDQKPRGGEDRRQERRKGGVDAPGFAGDWLGAIAWDLAGLFAQGAAAAETIKIGMQKPVGGPLYIANDKGYYAAEGLTPDYVFFEAGEPIAVAVASGAVDFGVAGLTGGFYSLAGQGRAQDHRRPDA